MTSRRDDLVNPGRRLPDLSFPALDGGGTHRLRQGRRSPVLLLVHDSHCAACRAYVRKLEEWSASLGEWDGRILVLSPEHPEDVPGTKSDAIPILADPERRIAGALSVRHPAVIIADQWGQVHASLPAGEDHDFPSASEIEEWLRFLAIQCPECEGEAL